MERGTKRNSNRSRVPHRETAYEEYRAPGGKRKEPNKIQILNSKENEIAAVKVKWL